MNTGIIQVENVSKKFCRNLRRSMWYGVQDIGMELIGRNRSPELRKEEFWAIDNISFSLNRGECLGLIGHNGAGKSTLLKLLNGLVKPDKGRIVMGGRVGALIELGAGFNPILTGRENVYNNGAVLGFTKKEIDQKFDAIVDFSEIGDFIDTPVQNYSSGMKVRLGFSVAAQMNPDILLIDEVLAVGDLNFKLKCFNLIDRLVENCAVIFVSHSMQQVSRLCNQILIMDHGVEKYMGGDISKGIDIYYGSLGGRVDFIREDTHVKILKVLINDNDDKLPLVNRLDDLNITLIIEIDGEFETAVSSVIIFDNEQKPIGVCMSNEPLNKVATLISRENGRTRLGVNILIPRNNFSKGIYYVTLTMSEKVASKPIARLNNIKAFQVTSYRDVWAPMELEGVWQGTGDLDLNT